MKHLIDLEEALRLSEHPSQSDPNIPPGTPTVPEILKPYVGATHFKSGRPLPAVLASCVAPQSPDKFTRELWRLSSDATGSFWNIMMYLQRFLIPAALLSLTGAGYDACHGMTRSQWSAACFAVCWGFPALYCFGKAFILRSSTMGGRSPLLKENEPMYRHISALLLLHLQDRCCSATKNEVVHKFAAGNLIFTVFSDGLMTTYTVPGMPEMS